MEKAEQELKDYQEKLERQLIYAQTLNVTSETIASNNDEKMILESMVQLAGQALGVDRSLIYYVNLEENMSFGLCEWNNQKTPGITPCLGNWNLSVFKNTVEYAIRSKGLIESHSDEPSGLLKKDGIVDLLHRNMAVKSLLYYPFLFSEQGFYLIIFHQVSHIRKWQKEEVKFLESLAKQVEIALQKIQLLKERQETMVFLEHQLAAMEASMDGFGVISPDGIYTYVNEAFAKIFGFSQRSELIGRKWKDLYPEWQRKRFREETIPKFWEKGKWRGEVLGTKKDGTIVEQEISLTSVKGNGLVCVVRDITERKAAEKAIWEQKERAMVTLESIGDAVITTDEKGRVKYLNLVAEELTGWFNEEACELELTEVFSVVSEESGFSIGNPVDRCLREGRVIKCKNNTTLVHKDGYKFAVESSAAPIRNREGQIIGSILVFRDVTEKRRLLQQMSHQTTHDALTGLPNRLLFKDRLTQALAQTAKVQKKLAVMFMDLDRFKHVNDLLGHAAGDQLLIQVADRLKKAVRQGDTIARLGGDEFTILVSQIDHEENAAEIAKDILKIFEAPFTCGDREFHITASIGIALFPSDGEDSHVLMKHADSAMYRAKETTGSSFHLFTQALNEKVLLRLNMENCLRHAIERQELVLFFQPKVNVCRWWVTGFEALIRWNHPEKGLVSPAEFIPLAEETGLILPLGDWVLKEACLQHKRWSREGFGDIRIGVNLSAHQLYQPGFVDRVKSIVAEFGISPGIIEFEITESVAMQDVELAMITLGELQDLGFDIAVDDFGTGHSSLSYLKRFPINSLKIDRSFVKDINNNSKDSAIVSSIVALAQNLGLEVVAEGVESRSQINILKKLGCHEMQGFYFSRPLSADKIHSLIEQKGRFTDAFLRNRLFPQPVGV